MFKNLCPRFSEPRAVRGPYRGKHFDNLVNFDVGEIIASARYYDAGFLIGAGRKLRGA